MSAGAAIDFVRGASIGCSTNLPGDVGTQGNGGPIITTDGAFLFPSAIFSHTLFVELQVPTKIEYRCHGNGFTELATGTQIGNANAPYVNAVKVDDFTTADS